MITVRKITGGYAVFKDGRQWTMPLKKIEAKRAADLLRGNLRGKK